MLAFIPFVLGNWRLLAYGSAIAALIGLGLYEHHKIYVEGEQAAVQNVEKANAQASAQAQVGSDTVDLCYRSGGIWDRATGVCQHNAGR